MTVQQRAHSVDEIEQRLLPLLREAAQAVRPLL